MHCVLLLVTWLTDECETLLSLLFIFVGGSKLFELVACGTKVGYAPLAYRLFLNFKIK